MLGLQRLRVADGSTALGGWRTWAGGQVSRTPGGRTLLDTPAERVEAELRLLGDQRWEHTRWVTETGLADLVGAMTRFHEVAIAPVSRQLRAVFEAERMVRDRILLDQGRCRPRGARRAGGARWGG